MAARHRVLCIHKNNRASQHERITDIGGKKTDGQWWELSAKDAIEGIEDGRWEFYVFEKGQESTVIVVPRSGVKYLTTTRDETKANNLLSLDEC